MIHARDDYNRIQDPYGLIGITEPVFLLRAKDKHAPNTIRHWAKLNQESGNTDPLVNIGATWAEVMENWQKEHGCKLPDITNSSNTVVSDSITHSFGSAFDIARRGGLIARLGWTKSGIFVFVRPSDEIHIDILIDKLKSLPQSVKDYYMEDVCDHNGDRTYPASPDDKVKFSEYLCMKDEDGSIINGWLPSQADLFATDWFVVEMPIL